MLGLWRKAMFVLIAKAWNAKESWVYNKLSRGREDKRLRRPLGRVRLP